MEWVRDRRGERLDEVGREVTFLTDIIGSWTVTVGVFCVSKLFLIDADEIVMVLWTLAVGSRQREGVSVSCRCCGSPLSSGCVTWAFLYRNPMGRINLSYNIRQYTSSFLRSSRRICIYIFNRSAGEVGSNYE